MKNLVIISILSITTFVHYGQYRTDIGINFGGSNYLGEIGGKEQTRRNFIFDMKLKETKTSFGAFIRHRFNDSYGTTTTLTFANISGADKYTTNPARNNRNLSFKNTIIELSTRAEYYFYTIHDVGNHGRYWVNFRPYVFAGVGVFYHNPKAKYKGEWHDLRPLKTEGQTKEYTQLNISIPAGIGLYFTYKNRYRVSLEMVYRKTFTDYLDDVSDTYPSEDRLQTEIAKELSNRNTELSEENKNVDPANYEAGNKRGDKKNKDSFFTGHVGVSYVMRGRWYVKVVGRGPYRPRVRKIRTKF